MGSPIPALRPRESGELRPTDLVAAFFLPAIAFLLAAAAVAVLQSVSPWPWGRWLTLHLAFVGGVSQLVLGAGQFFAAAFLATDPPPRAVVRVQLLGWNAGALLLAVAVPTRTAALTWVAVALLLGGLLAWGAAIDSLRRRSLRRSPWATRWYLAGACLFGFGIVAGSLLAHGTAWPHGDLLSAHMALNLAGWFGAAIVGTLHGFFPSLTQTQLRFPRLQGAAFLFWTGGVAALALGYGWRLEPLASAGWAGLCVGAAALLANVAACLWAAPRPLSRPARVVATAQPFLLAGLALGAASALADGPASALSGSLRTTVGTLLVSGWIGLTVLGSLAHILAVAVRVRGGFATPMPLPRPALDRSLAALAAVGVAGLALAQALELGGVDRVAALALLCAYAALAVPVAALSARLLTQRRPRL